MINSPRRDVSDSSLWSDKSRQRAALCVRYESRYLETKRNKGRTGRTNRRGIVVTGKKLSDFKILLRWLHCVKRPTLSHSHSGWDTCIRVLDSQSNYGGFGRTFVLFPWGKELICCRPLSPVLLLCASGDGGLFNVQRRYDMQRLAVRALNWCGTRVWSFVSWQAALFC